MKFSALAKSAPSIKSFNGQGNMITPDGCAERSVEQEINNNIEMTHNVPFRSSG
jgi:hypothetical protein